MTFKFAELLNQLHTKRNMCLGNSFQGQPVNMYVFFFFFFLKHNTFIIKTKALIKQLSYICDRYSNKLLKLHMTHKIVLFIIIQTYRILT